MFSASDLSMRFGDKILFRNAHFQLNPGRHYALVGPNGSGKSTLIKILSGESTPEKGEIHRSSLMRLGTLKQDHYLYENETILDTVLIGKPRLWEGIKSKEKLLENPDLTEQQCHELADFEKIIEEQDGYMAESQAGELLEGLGLKTNVHLQKLHTLSGGYKLRVLLAQVLFSKPDILLLDEPTNHLDLYSIKWLEDYIRQFEGTVLISSHDRSFLNGIATDVMDLDYESVKIYPGNYDQFEEAKAWNLAQKEAQLAKQEKKKEDLQEFIDRFGAKATKAKQAQSKLKIVEKLENAMEALQIGPSSRQAPALEFKMQRPSGVVALRVNGIRKSYGAKKVLEQVTFEVERGEKVAILGANGIGKSTLLEILTSRSSADAGLYEWGHAAGFAYFPQDHGSELCKSLTLLEWLCGALSGTPEQKARQILGQVLFSGDDVHKKIGVLSGGEMARLILAKMMLQQQNVLIFDEPTNHLDLEAIEALLASLKNYTGTVLFVSHNRYFVSNIATRVIELTDYGLQDFKCTYQEYLEKKNVDHLDRTQKRPTADKIPSTKQSHEEMKKQRNNKTQLEKQVKKSEELCSQLESKIAQINTQLAAECFYVNTSQEEQANLVLEKTNLENQLNLAIEEWEKNQISLQKLQI